jgi:hypothetical protein
MVFDHSGERVVHCASGIDLLGWRPIVDQGGMAC